MSATILIPNVPTDFLRKNQHKKGKKQITDINMCHQDKEEIAENTAGHQSQQIKDSRSGSQLSEQISTAKATIKNNQMLNKKTERIKGTLNGDKVGLK